MDRSDLANRMKSYEKVSKTDNLTHDPLVKRREGLLDNYISAVEKGALFDARCFNIPKEEEFTSDAWFDYEVQKLTSVSASMATMAFNKYFSENVVEFLMKRMPVAIRL